jgi:hypothetical protein
VCSRNKSTFLKKQDTFTKKSKGIPYVGFEVLTALDMEGVFFRVVTVRSSEKLSSASKSSALKMEAMFSPETSDSLRTTW